MIKQSLFKNQNQDCQEQSLTKRFVTEDQQDQQDEEKLQQRNLLQFKIQCLEGQLLSARERENKLKVTNSQLSNMILSSSHSNSLQTDHFVSKIEDLIQEKLKLTYQNNKIDLKINELNLNSNFANSAFSKKDKHHNNLKNLSNFSTIGSLLSHRNTERQGNQQNNLNFLNKLSKKDIKDRMSCLKRMEMKVNNN